MTEYVASPTRYADQGFFRRCGKSGLRLPAVSLGCWHNFGAAGTDAGHHGDEAGFHENCRRMLFTAFDAGITHFDLANNYGPPPGSAEERVGRIVREDFGRYRDELIISTKAGYTMWDGPYGDWGSRKYMLASLDASLKRLGLEYVDIYYSHRPDPQTPIEETLGALEQAVRSGKALYTGISNYRGGQTAEVAAAAREHDWHMPIIHQPKYSMFERWIEPELLPVAEKFGIGLICFSPLAQGLLTDKYLRGIPADSRATLGGFLKPAQITPEKLDKIRRLHDVARARGQSLAQMALSWVLRHPIVASVLIGASKPEQIRENVAGVKGAPLCAEELEKIERILSGEGGGGGRKQ
jgi:L-glyceraldehyde 3-phosphate reductase